MPEKIKVQAEAKTPQKQVGKFKVPDEVKSFVKTSEKKFKKDYDGFGSKKETRAAYFDYLIDMLPKVISTVIKFGHLPEMKEAKEEVFNKISDEKFIKYMTKGIKNDELEFTNMRLLPIIIAEIVAEAKKAEAASTDGEKFEVEDLVEFSHLLLKKKIKKMEKSGVDSAIAFDVLSIIPDLEILKKSTYFHLRKLFACLYEHAKTKENINFGKIIDVLFKDDEDYISGVITFALLERKEKTAAFNTSQQLLYSSITSWALNTLEDMKKADIEAVLKAYIAARKRDIKAGKDTARRYYISACNEKDMPKITKLFDKMKKSDNTIENF